MKICRTVTATLVSALVIGCTAGIALADMPKYVFFFLGDGMSSAQIQAAEAYLTTENGGSSTLAKDLMKSENRLNMSKMPVSGMQTTYDAHALMTDSGTGRNPMPCIDHRNYHKSTKDTKKRSPRASSGSRLTAEIPSG